MNHSFKLRFNARGKAAAGLSILALSLPLSIVPLTAMAPTGAHAQIFDDEDDKEIPGQQPTDNTVWDAKKLQRLDRNVRKLERSVSRVQNQKSPPILIEPDPEVVALQATVDTLSRKQDDQAATIMTLTGQIEDLQHQNQQLLQQITNQNARLDTLVKRADLADAHLKDIDAQLAPPPPPPASLGNAESDFEQAFNLMTSGKVDDADRAFEAFTTTWPQSSQLPEAWFRLGQIRAMKSNASGAVAAYATSLKGWPKTSWAPEATVKLAQALSDTNRPTDVCATLAQFEKNYAKAATTDTRSLAKTLKDKNRCAAA
ncbi:tetratricopeptide repeat protein [Asticcacaulis sp. 201]|uniref:tetratricopeptide repeat protein n=1 Tax=Asticcacaulis sp. 201 TaxID=3028787 RepID=UPI002917012E|nr:tetratricopeptide repeat protein [Asticcacaulis sp. 201]MDV6332515.1 tetratricopeptide repeat protein [Asticcacaulis sp. 201]